MTTKLEAQRQREKEKKKDRARERKSGDLELINVDTFAWKLP